MGIMQAYQTDLIKGLDNSGEVGLDDIKEIRRAADLFLWATKETASSIGRSMAALVATERHLWLNLSGINEKDKAFLIDAPLSGLFGDAINTVIERFQEAMRQSAAFKKFIPLCHSRSQGVLPGSSPTHQPPRSDDCHSGE